MGPGSGGRLVFDALLTHEAAALAAAHYSMVLHNGDVLCACGQSMIHEYFGTMSLSSRSPRRCRT